MSEVKKQAQGPNLAEGVALSSLGEDSILLGHVQGKPAILVRHGDELFAIGAVCTHYSGPLAEGLVVGDTVRCPWHHACFSLRTGEALRAPALSPVPCWRVDRQDGKAFVREKLDNSRRLASPAKSAVPDSVVIVGGGAAGSAAAEMLRREGYAGRLTMLSADQSAPYDRPNLSKSYLAGNAPEEWMPLHSTEFYREHDIDLKLGARVAAIDPANRQVMLVNGDRHTYDALLLATGAEPERLGMPGGDRPHVHYLRSFADSRALVADAVHCKRAVVIGTGFIGLEVAASLRARDIAVHVVGLETCPMEKILGAEVGNFIRKLHEDHGVIFHLGTTASAIDERGVVLRNKEVLPADLIVIGVGVRPAVALAKQAGVAIDRGVTVDEYLETSVPGIFAAGDIARWPDPLTGERIRVEHWVVAQRQGQTAARNILGRRERFDAVPFFWTEQYDFGLAYVGHAERFDEVRIDGLIDARDCTVTFSRSGRRLAVAAIHRDLEGLRAEVEFENTIAELTHEPAAGGSSS